MKKRTLKRLCGSFLTLCIVSLIIYACTEESWTGESKAEEVNSELTVEAAEEWYLVNNLPVMELRNSTEQNEGVLAKPDWNKAKTSKKSKYQVVETPLTTKGNVVFMDSETKERMNKKADSRDIRNTSRMVVIKDMKTGKVRNFIMIFVGTYDYLKKSKTMGKNSYLKREKDYTGKVLFCTPQGSLINGWKYENGKISGRISRGSSENTIQLRSGYDYCYDDWEF